MKTIKEQIEVMQHFDDGGKVKSINRDSGLSVTYYQIPLVFNWLAYDYEAYEEYENYFYREIGETDWIECSKEQYEYARKSHELDTKMVRVNG